MINQTVEGVLFLAKPVSNTSFQIVYKVRKCFHVQRVGHAGTLDPFAEGLLIILVGRRFTRIQDSIMQNEKEYIAHVKLGISTDSFDHTGRILSQSDYVPSIDEVYRAIEAFQGEIEQTPPMFSAKKIDGKRLYALARKGKTVERKSAMIHVTTVLEEYAYPYVKIRITCSKGTYIRSIAHDIGNVLTCGAHLEKLVRTRSGKISLDLAENIDCLRSFEEAYKVLTAHTELFCNEYREIIEENQY